MKENDEEENNEINTNSHYTKNKNISLKTNTYISTINEKSTIADENNLLNNDIPFSNSNITNYIQSSIHSNSEPINSLSKIDEKIEINELSSRFHEKSIIDKLCEKVDSK